jgi:ankyrin repeat protein
LASLGAFCEYFATFNKNNIDLWYILEYNKTHKRYTRYTKDYTINHPNQEIFETSMQNPLLKLIKPSTIRDLDTMRELITNEVDKSIDINEQDRSGTTVLHWAVRRWYFDLAKLALQKDAEPNIKDVDGNSPLHIASHSGDHAAKMLLLLLEHGAEVNIRLPA